MGAPGCRTGTKIDVDSEAVHGLAEGDHIKFDCGLNVGGYRGDGGRTSAYSSARPEARNLYAVIADAHRLARAQVTPGTPIRDVFAAAEQHIRTNGCLQFTRGHYWHSVGIDTFHQEPPFIAADEERPLMHQDHATKKLVAINDPSGLLRTLGVDLAGLAAHTWHCG